MESVFDEEKKEAIIQYCNFAFKNIYGESDKFTHENGKDIESLISFLQIGNGDNWINIINFSCNTSFQIKSRIRRFNLIEPSDYIMKKFNVSFSYTLDVLFRLMEVYVFKTIDVESKIKIIRSLFHIYDYNPKNFEDGINFIQIIKNSCNIDISGVNDDPDSRFNFFYDFLESQDVDIFFDKNDFKNIYKSETLVLLHLGQLLDKTGNLDFDIPPERILGKTNQIIKSLLFFEVFYINKTDVLHLKPQKITFDIDINSKTVKMTQYFDNEEDLGTFYLIKAKEATLFYDEPENLEVHEIFPNDYIYQTFSIENIQKFAISATRDISIGSKDIKTLLLLFELNSFYLNSENLIQFSLSFKTPFKMDKINLSKYSINASGKTSKKFKLETSEKKFSVEITKTHKNVEDEMQFCGLGYLTVDDFEYCIIKKIEFLGNFEKDLNGIVKIKFVSNLDKVFPVNYYFPPNLSSIKNVLYDLATVKKNQDEDNFYFLGNLRPKIEHELRFNIQLPGESVEDEWLANLPVSANVGIKPEIDIKVENRNMYINTFPDKEFIKIAIPLKFDPTTDLDKAYPDLFDQISMGAIVFVRQQKLVACQVDETKYELNLDNSLLKVTKTASFDAPVDKEIYVLTENTKKPEKAPINSNTQSIYSNDNNFNNNNNNNNNNNINNNSNNNNINNSSNININDNNFNNNISNINNNNSNNGDNNYNNNDNDNKESESVETYDDFEIYGDLHFKEIKLKNKPNFRAFSIGKMKPNEQFKITSQKKIQIDISDVHFFKFTLMFDTLKEFVKIPYIFKVSSSTYQIKSISIGNKSVNFKNKKSVQFKMESKEPKSDFVIEKSGEDILEKMTSIGSGYLTIDKFELWPINRIEFIGQFTNFLEGRMKILFNHSPYINTHFYHSNPKQKIQNFTSDSKPVNEHEHEDEEEKKNFFPLILNSKNKEHEIQFDIKLDAEMGDDNWILTFPVTHWKEYDNPSFHFQIENKNILIEKYPFTDSLKVVINYDLTPQTLIKQWDSLLNDVNSFYAVYFDKFDLVPCSLESLSVDINVIERRYKISKVFSIASKNKKTVYILANRDSQFNWKRNDVKIEVDDVPFDVYSIGSYSAENNISLSCYKDLFIVDDLLKSASFTIKNDILKNSDFFINQARVHVQSDFAMEAINFSDMKFKFEPSFDYEFEAIIADEEVEVVLFRESKNILNEFQSKELGYFTIGNYDILGIKGINIVGIFDDGHLEGQIEYKVEGTQLDDPIYFHSGSNSLHLSNLRIDSIEKDVDDYESLKIGKLPLLNIDNLNNNNEQVQQVNETQNDEEEEYEYEVYDEEEEKIDNENKIIQQNSFFFFEEEEEAYSTNGSLNRIKISNEEEEEVYSTNGSLNRIKISNEEEEELNSTNNKIAKSDEDLKLDNNKTKIVKKTKKVKKRGNKAKQGNENNKLNDEIKNCHSIVFDFLFNAELTDDSWEINFPITRFKTMKDPLFHFEIKNHKIIVNTLPSEFVHVRIPINNDPSIVFKKWKTAFKSIHFGYAVVLHQMKVIPCREIEMGYLEANLIKNTIVMKRNFRLPIKFKKEVFIIASKKAEVEYPLAMNRFVVEDVPYDIFSIGTQITKKKFQVLFHRKNFIDNYSIKVCSFIIKNDLLKETEANPNALHNIIHIVSSFKKIDIQIDDDKIEQKFETKNFEKEIEVDKEETKVTVYNKKGNEFDEFELRNFGYFTIGEDIKVLGVKDIKIISNFEYGKLEGEVTYIVEDSQYKESIYYHEIPSKIEFSNLRVDNKSIEINKIEKETENLIEIGNFEKVSEEHFVEFSFTYEIEMVENDWNIHFPITRYKDRKKNPPFYFEIENQNIKIEELPSDDDFIDINISIPDEPEKNLKKWKNVYSNISLGQACFFYQGKIHRCELIRTLIEVDLINNLSHCTKLFKQPKGFGSKQIYFLVSKDIEVENTERKLFKKIELDKYPFDIFLVGFVEPGYEFQLRTLQKFKINDLFIFKKSFILKNDVIMNELKSKKVKRNKKTKKIIPSPSLIFIHIEADFIISSVECLDQILQNSEESDSFNFSIETNEKEFELKVTKIASDFLSKIKKKGLGYFTICNFDLLMIDEIIITSTFNNNGILSGVIEFKIEGIQFDEDILYYPGSESIHLSNLRLDSEIVIEEEEEEPEMSQSSKSVETSKNPINLGKIKKFINDNAEQEENQNENDDDDDDIKELSIDGIDEKNKKRYHSVMFDFTYNAEMAEETWEIDFPITRYNTPENPLFLFEVKDPPIRIDKLPKSVIHLSIPINNDPNIIFKKWEKTFKCIYFGFAVFIHQMNIIPLEVIEKGFMEANLIDNTIYMERKFNPPTKPNKTVYIIASKEVEVIVDSSLKLKKIDVDEIPFNIYTLGKKASTKKFKVKLLKNLVVNNKSIKRSYFYYGNDLINDIDPDSNSLKSEVHVIAPYKDYNIQIDDNEIVDDVDIQNEETKVTVHNIVKSGIDQLDIKNLGFFTIDEDFKLLETEDIKIISNFDYGKLEGEIKFIVEDCQYEELIYYHEFPSNVQLSNLQIDDENIEINRVTKETENLIEIGHFKEMSEKHFIQFSFTLDNPMIGNNWNIIFPITRFINKSQNPPYLFEIENESIKIQEIPYDKDYLEINIEIPDEPEKNLEKWEDIYSNISLGQSCIFYQGTVKRCELIQTQIEIDLTNEIVHCTKLFKQPIDFGPKKVYFLISKDVEFENPEKKIFKKIKSKEKYPFDIIQSNVFDPGKEFYLKTSQKIQIKNLSINKISFTFNNDVIRSEYEEKKKFPGKVSVHINSNTAIDTVETLGNIYENTEKSNEIDFDFETDEKEIKVNVRKGFREFLSKIQLKDLGYFTIDDYELLMIKEIKVQSSFKKGILTGEVEFKVNGTENNDTIFYYFGSKSLELSDLRIDSNPIDFDYDGPGQRKINIGNIVENEGEEGVLHSIVFSFQLKAVVNEDNWEITFPITRYSEEAGENPEFLFEEKNEKIHINELPMESLFFTFELIPDPHILLSLVDFDESSIFSLYYLDHLKMAKCQTKSTFIDVDLRAQVLNLSHTFEMPKQEKDKREVFLLTKLSEEDIRNTFLVDSEYNFIEKYAVENDNFNAFYIGERNTGSFFTITIVSEIEIRETSIKRVEFDFVNDSDATFSMQITSDFSMNQFELRTKETSLDFPCFNKKKIEITDQTLRPAVVTCVLERTKTNIIDGLSYSNLGYFTIDDFCLLPIEKIEFIGNSDNELKGIVTFTLKNEYDFNIDVYYAPPPFVHSLLVDETGEVEINSEKFVNISQFGPSEVHYVRFEITIQKTLIEDGDDFKEDDEDEKEMEKEQQKDYIYRFPLTYFTSIQNPDFYFEIENKEIKIDNLPNAPYLEVSMITSDLTIHKFDPYEIDTNMMNLIFMQGNQEFIGPLTKRNFKATVSEMKASILCDSIYYNPSSYPVRYKIIFHMNLFDLISSIRINDRIEVSKESFTKMVENNRNSYVNLNRKILSKGKIKISFTFTTKVEEEVKVSKISFRNEPLTADHVYIPSYDYTEEESFIEELKKIVHFEFCNHENTLIPWGEKPCNFTLPQLEARFLFATNKKVITQRISQCMNGTMIFKLKQQRNYFIFQAKEVHYKCEVTMCEGHAIQKVEMTYKSPLDKAVECVHCIYNDPKSNIKIDGGYADATFLTNEPNFLCFVADDINPNEEGFYSFTQTIPMTKDSLASKYLCSIPCDANTELVINTRKLSDDPIIKYRPEFLEKNGDDKTGITLSGHVQYSTNLNVKIYYESNLLESLRIACQNSSDLNATFSNISKSYHKLVGVFKRSGQLKDKIDIALIGFLNSLNGQKNSIINDQFKVDFNDFSKALSILADEGNIILKDYPRKSLEIEIEMFNSSFNILKIPDKTERAVILPIYYSCHDVLNKKNDLYINLQLPMNSSKDQIIPLLSIRLSSYVVYISTNSLIRNLIKKKLSSFTKVFTDDQNGVLNFNGERMIAVFKPFHLIGLFNKLSKNELNEFISKTLFVFDDFDDSSPQLNILIKKIVMCIISLRSFNGLKDGIGKFNTDDDIDDEISKNQIKILRISNAKLQEIDEDKILKEEQSLFTTTRRTIIKEKTKKVADLQTNAPFPINARIISVDDNSDALKNSIQPIVHQVLSNGLNSYGPIVIRLPNSKMVNDVNDAIQEEIKSFKSDLY